MDPYTATEIAYRNGYIKGKEDAIGEELVGVVEMLRTEYERAKKLPFVRKPLAYALYKVWKKVDKSRR